MNDEKPPEVTGLTDGRSVRVEPQTAEERRQLLAKGFKYRRHQAGAEKFRRLRQAARQAGRDLRAREPVIDGPTVRLAWHEWHLARKDDVPLLTPAGWGRLRDQFFEGARFRPTAADAEAL